MAQRLDSNWTLPNLFTIIRIIITPVFVMAFVQKNYILAWWLFFFAGVSDGLDGFLARALKQRSHLGAMLDPVADKVLLVTSFTLLGLEGWLPSWLVILVVSRDAIIVGGLILLRFLTPDIQKIIRPSWMSKVTTTFQIVLVFSVILANAMVLDLDGLKGMLIMVVTVFTVISGLHYIYKGFGFFPSQESG